MDFLKGFILPMLGLVAVGFSFAFAVIKILTENNPKKLKIWTYVLPIITVLSVIFFIFFIRHMATKARKESAPKARAAVMKKEPPATKKLVAKAAASGLLSPSCGRPAPRKVGATFSQAWMINYAWAISDCDEKFIAMIEAESQWQPFIWERIVQFAQGKLGGKEKIIVRGNGFGLCQIDNRYWPTIQADPKFQQNWAYQAHVCLKLWRAGVKFYGANRNDQMISRFWWSPQKES